jgi:serine protease Do
VRIVSGGVGAGIIIESGESRSLVLTAWHVPRGAASVKVQNGSGEFEAANIYYAPNGIDLSVIEIAGNIGPAVSFAEDAPWQGMDVVAVGSPLGGNDITTFGRIIGFVDVNSRGLSFQGLLTDAAINPGNSGGGVYSAETGELIGIVVSKPMLNPFQSAEGIGLVIPVSVLSQIPLDSWPRAQPPAGWRESDDH